MSYTPPLTINREASVFQSDISLPSSTTRTYLGRGVRSLTHETEGPASPSGLYIISEEVENTKPIPNTLATVTDAETASDWDKVIRTCLPLGEVTNERVQYIYFRAIEQKIKAGESWDQLEAWLKVLNPGTARRLINAAVKHKNATSELTGKEVESFVERIFENNVAHLEDCYDMLIANGLKVNWKADEQTRLRQKACVEHIIQCYLDAKKERGTPPHELIFFEKIRELESATPPIESL